MAAAPAVAGTFTFTLATYLANPGANASQVVIQNPNILDQNMYVVGLNVQSGTTETDASGMLTLSKPLTSAYSTAEPLYFYDSSTTIDVATSTVRTSSLSGLTSTANLKAGMLVIGPGIALGTTITSVAANSVALSQNSGTGSGTGTFAFMTAPTDATSQTGVTTAGSTTLTISSGTGGLFPGMEVGGPGIATGTTIETVSGAIVTLARRPDQVPDLTRLPAIPRI